MTSVQKDSPEAEEQTAYVILENLENQDLSNVFIWVVEIKSTCLIYSNNFCYPLEL